MKLIFREPPFQILLILAALSLTTAAIAMGQNSPDERVVSSHKRTMQIERLIKVLRNEKILSDRPEETRAAMIRLGELKAVEAIEDLVRLLTYRYQFDWERTNAGTIVQIQPIHTANRYPATSALAQIGLPALPALVKVVESEDVDPLLTRNAWETIMFIHREHPEDGVKFLEDSAAKSDSPEKAQRLRSAAARASALWRMNR